MTNYLPERLVRFDADDLADHGLYDLIRRQGDLAALGHPDAGRAHRDRRGGRGCSRRAAAERLITAIRITYDDHGQAVEYGSHIYAASRYTFEINLLT